MTTTPGDVTRASGPAGALLAVWDVKGGFHGWAHYREAYEWARAHGLDPDGVCRIEFYLVGAPFARVTRYRYLANGDGFTTGEATTEEVTVMLSEPPPQHLRCFQ